MLDDVSLAVLRWRLATKQLSEAQIEENQARLALVALCYDKPTEGVNNKELPDGSILAATFRINYNLDSKSVEEKFKQLPPAIAKSLVTWQAKLKVGAYKGLEPAHKAVVNEVLTTSPGMPALEIVKGKDQA